MCVTALNPVHRRVLFGMNELGNTHNKALQKIRPCGGDVMGKYHPHGDASVYDTMVRMAQPWSLRYMLIDGQGNFGSIDGDYAGGHALHGGAPQKIAGSHAGRS